MKKMMIIAVLLSIIVSTASNALAYHELKNAEEMGLRTIWNPGCPLDVENE